jgi:hypothetical protein
MDRELQKRLLKFPVHIYSETRTALPNEKIFIRIGVSALIRYSSAIGDVLI